MNSLLKANNWGTLTKAPIVQAVFHLEFTSDDENWLESYYKMFEEIQEALPVMQEQRSANIDIPNESDSSKSKITGLAFKAADGSITLFVSKSVFAVVHSKHYTDWDTFMNVSLEYLKKLNIYRKLNTVSKQSARFVNRILLPTPMNDLREWLNTYLVISPEASKDVQTYYVNYSHAIPDKNISINVINAIGKQEDGALPFFFDIDVIDKTEDEFNLSTVASSFETLRTIKNNVFFLGLTERTINMLR